MVLFLPHLMFAHLANNYAESFPSLFPSEGLETFWEQTLATRDDRLVEHPLKKGQWKKKLHPLFLHGDGVAYESRDTLMTWSLVVSWHQTSQPWKPIFWWPAILKAPLAMRHGQRFGTTYIGHSNVWPRGCTPPVIPMANPWNKGIPCMSMQGKHWHLSTGKQQSGMS